MRPKYALWLVVAAVSSTWYMTDPQAKDSRASIRAALPTGGTQIAIVHPDRKFDAHLSGHSAL